MANEIQWADGAVCYAYGKQQYPCLNLENFLNAPDFQLNHIRTGDYIQASELDTEQKYNDVVEVFGLFGFEFGEWAERTFKGVSVYGNLTICHNEIYVTELTKKWCKRQLTYSQVMAIGKLKRMMDERSKRADGFEGDYKSHPKINHCDIDGTGSAPIRRGNKSVVAEVMLDLTERMEQGIKTYGEALRPHNGRDALQDAYEEALDLACYLKQAMIERDLN